MFHCETTLVYTLHKFSITTFEGSLQNEINNFCNECQNFFTLHCQYWPQKSSASQVPVLTGSGNEFSEWSHSWVPCNHSYCCEVSLKTLFLLDVIKSSTHNKMAWQKKKERKKKGRLCTKTVMPCSLQSIAAAHSKRLTTTQWTENLSSLSLPRNTKPKASQLQTAEA